MSSELSYKVYHSPDTDDLLLFWQLIHLDRLNGRQTECKGLDTEQLNQAAIRGEPDICAVSAAILPQLTGRYLLSPFGASVGRGFGPVVISKQLRSISDLKGLRVAIPGPTTTAALVFEKLSPESELITIPISPFTAIFDALDAGNVDAAVVIHEGQLAYKGLGFMRITDIGAWWYLQTGLPLPLGVNVVRAFTNHDEIRIVHTALKESVLHGLSNTKDLLNLLLQRSPELAQKLPAAEDFERYLGMYANQDSRYLDEDCMRSLEILLGCKFPILYDGLN